MTSGRRLFAVSAAAAALTGGVAPSPAEAGKADVLEVDVACRPSPGGRPTSICQFSVTVQHEDSGWDHYANAFEIVAPDGSVIATRVLQHPHIEEQPFRRSLPRVRIPHEVKQVEVRARDLVHGLGGKTVTVEIPHAEPKAASSSKAPAEGEAK